MKTLLSDFISFFYPNYCSLCGKNLTKNEEYLCSHCLIGLPKTDFHLSSLNPLAYLFIGKVRIEAVTAYFYFKKGSNVQTLIHQLKYRGQQEIGSFFGYLMGLDLKESELFNSVDIIIPVPLHANKKRKRGYNQSELIAIGVQKALSKPLDTKTLIRHIDTDTQTKRTQYNRWENTHDIFVALDEQKLENKHILLIDDVITTGSTLEAAAYTLLQIPNTRVSIACLACAVL
ncbi:MAG TPA: phosphoribosyltransferase family protein [Bacteroidales bacterium]|nr:phosphoribosyltransferase family protein [Bacteroidales bacterium]